MVPPHRRRSIYRLIHRGRYRALRRAVFQTPKGTISLRRCDELRAIFVHTPKTAGISVALSIFGERPGHHMAADYLAIFGRRTFASYFTFTFVRNPWDRLLSAYTFLARGGWDENDRAWSARHLSPYRDFADFVRRGLDRPEIQGYTHFIPQHEYVCDMHGRVLVKYVGYFETISRDFRAIGRRIGIEAELSFTNRGADTDYREAYDHETRAIVARVYARDIEIFGYDFDGIVSRVASDAHETDSHMTTDMPAGPNHGSRSESVS